MFVIIGAMIGGRCCCEVEFPVFPCCRQSGSSHGSRMYYHSETSRTDTTFGNISGFTHQRGEEDAVFARF